MRIPESDTEEVRKILARREHLAALQRANPHELIAAKRAERAKEKTEEEAK
ncbi:hypothetical protein [Methylobacterium sp. Gmos1]